MGRFVEDPDFPLPVLKEEIYEFLLQHTELEQWIKWQCHYDMIARGLNMLPKEKYDEVFCTRQSHFMTMFLLELASGRVNEEG